jgi:hypothetical protein
MTPRPRFIIADRRYQFAAGLVCLLNAMNLARATGARLLMTWDRRQDYDLIGSPSEIFAGDLAARYDAETGTGCVIAADAELVAQAARGVDPIKTPEAETIDDYYVFVAPQFENAVAYAVDLRCSVYASGAGAPDFRRETRNLAACFAEIPKPPILADAMAAVAEALPDGANFAALHGRRLHYLADTGVQIARFNSHCSDELCLELVGSLSGFDAVLVASDSDAFVDRMRAGSAGRLLTVRDLGIDLGGLTPTQRALIDIWFLSRAGQIYGAYSAFGFAASMIGGGEFRNILVHAARHRIGAGSRAVAFHTARFAGELPQFARMAQPGPDAAAMFWRLGVHLRSEWPFNLQVDAAGKNGVISSTSTEMRRRNWARPG